jgi:hypothetical protein
MPKLDATHLRGRIQLRLEQLEAGKSVAAKDIRAVLTAEQQTQLDSEWREQQLLRQQKRARTENEQVELGWKTKREVMISVLKRALAEAEDGELAALEEKMKRKKVRQARIYFEALKEAEQKGKTGQAAHDYADNALVRAGLRRLNVNMMRDGY